MPHELITALLPSRSLVAEGRYKISRKIRLELLLLFRLLVLSRLGNFAGYHSLSFGCLFSYVCVCVCVNFSSHEWLNLKNPLHLLSRAVFLLMLTYELECGWGLSKRSSYFFDSQLVLVTSLSNKPQIATC